MTTDRVTILSLTLTFLLIASAVPVGDLGFAGTAAANHHGGETFTLRQPSVGVCHEVDTFTHDHEKMVPEVEKRGSNDYGDVTGPYEDPDWNGPTTIESIMDYRYRYNPDGEGAVGQTHYYAPYLNDQYRAEGWEDGTYGLYNWSENNHSHLWFYENAAGEVSLVVRHDRLYEDVATVSHDPYNGMNGPHPGFFERSPGSGSASFEFDSLPAGEWAYIDDMYPKPTMSDYYVDDDGTRYGHREAEYDAAPLREFTGGYFSIDWDWGAWSTPNATKHGTDGGAYRGFHNLAPGESVTIDNEFWGDVEEWEVRNNNGSTNGVQRDLVMNESLTIERGANCLDADLSASPNPVEAGQSVTFTAPAGADEYRWDFDGDGTPENETADNSIQHTYDSVGDRQASVTVVSGSETTSDSTPVEVGPAEPPTAEFAVEDGAGDSDHHVVGESIRFDGSASSDSVGSVEEYEWTIDGTTETGERVNRTFSSPGEKDVTLTVTDQAGRTSNVTREVTIVEQDDPEAAAEASPTEIEAGAPVTLDGTASGDERGELVSYEWDFDGDGEPEETGPRVEWAYDAPGEQNATLTVTDNNGNADTADLTVSVTEASDPVIESTDIPSEVSVTGDFEVSANATDESDVTYAWTFSGGGNPAEKSGQHVTHSFDDQGTATVELVVTDAAGRTNSTGAIPVEVTGKPNAVLSADPNETEVDETVTLDASASTDDGSIDRYEWDVDGDDEFERNTTANATIDTTYGSSGTYDARVQVVDDDGSTANATATVEVESDEQAFDGGGGGGGGSVSLGPPPVVSETEQVGPNVTAVDVRNGRSGETVTADLFESAATADAGVQFRTLAVNLAGDDNHVLFRTAASADAPEGVPALDEDAATDPAVSAPDETLAYLDLASEYQNAGVGNATVEFTVERAALGEYSAPSDVTAYRYDGEWTRANATVVDASGDAYRLAVTADGLDTLAVGANQGLAVTDVALENDTVTPDERVAATATVENAGPTARTLTLNFTLSGGVVDSATVEVPAGETRAVTLAGSAPTPGTYEAAIEGESAGTFTVEQIDPADVSVTDVSLNRSTMPAGESVAITATIENAGGQPGERAVNLTMFGEQVASETVEVAAGETTQVTFVREVDAAGSYEVEVAGETATLDVTGTDGGDDPISDATGVPGFDVGAAVVALLAAVLLARARR